MKKHLCLVALALCAGVTFFTGCARLVSKTYDKTTGQVTSCARVTTFFDANSALTKFANRAETTVSNEWSAGTTIGGLNQSTSSTNLDQLIGIIVQAAVAGAAKGTLAFPQPSMLTETVTIPRSQYDNLKNIESKTQHEKP